MENINITISDYYTSDAFYFRDSEYCDVILNNIVFDNVDGIVY